MPNGCRAAAGGSGVCERDCVGQVVYRAHLVSDGDGTEASVAVQFVHSFVQVETQLNNEYLSLKKVTEVGVFRVAQKGISQRSM
jgi:hypothetical protein